MDNCQFFVKRKKRFCRMTVKKGNIFCGEHLENAIDTTEIGEGNESKHSKRVQCPIDPTQ